MTKLIGIKFEIVVRAIYFVSC